jgi:predicted glycoside hydrolase/deacetylase ChbG (UPF0249 family)
METIFVVNADDFGLCPEVNAGIVQGHSDGIITSTSVMTNMPYFQEVQALRQDHPDLGIGLHVCLSEGEPVSPVDRVRSLIDENGQFLSRPVLFDRLSKGKVELDEVALELEAQLQALEDQGVHPDHWNSHQYVHLHPRLLGVLKRVLSPRKVPCMRTHTRAYVSGDGWVTGGSKLKFYSQLPTRLAKDIYFQFEAWRSRRQGFRLPDAQLTRFPFSAPYDVLTDNATHGVPQGTYEWICHPATERRPTDKEIIDRPGELALLTRPGLKHDIESAGIRLATFSEALARK